MARPPAPPVPGRKPPPPPTDRAGQGSMELETSDLWAERREEREVDDFAARLDLATANLEAIALGSIDGSDPSLVTSLPGADPDRHESSAPSLPGAATEPAARVQAPAGAQALSQAKGAEGAPGKGMSGMSGSEALELDLERAGLSRAQGQGQVLPAQGPGALAAQAPAHQVASAVAAGLPIPEASAQAMARKGSPAVANGRVSLFGPDPVLAFLIAAAIGLLVGIVPASRSAHALFERETAALFSEMERSVDQPLAVRAGEMRAPKVIEAEITAKRAPARNRFLLIWLAAALPVTLVLGFVRRQA